MSASERLTITLSAELLAAIRAAVERGDYKSSTEVVREALHDWNVRSAPQAGDLGSLKEEIDRGLRDLAEGRITDFDARRIIERGRALSAGRSRSG